MIEGIDHFVLTVGDVARSVEFYKRVLDLDVITWGGEGDDRRYALRVGSQKINLHQADRLHAPFAKRPEPGAGDFCLLTREDVDELAVRLREQGIDLVEGPVDKQGALGPIRSIYVRDPDGNLVEVARYET